MHILKNIKDLFKLFHSGSNVTYISVCNDYLSSLSHNWMNGENHMPMLVLKVSEMAQFVIFKLTYRHWPANKIKDK